MLVAYNTTLTNATLTAPESEEPGVISEELGPGLGLAAAKSIKFFSAMGSRIFFRKLPGRPGAVPRKRKPPPKRGHLVED
jgi:hypothetical protein